MSPAALDFVLRHVIREVRYTALGMVKEHDEGRQQIRIERIPNYSGVPDADVRTPVDVMAQRRACALLEQYLPGWGRVGEENRLRVACTLGLPYELDITIDPLDGSKWLAELLRNPSLRRRNVYTMLSVRIDGEPVAAYMMSLFGGELFWVAPGDDVIRVQAEGREEVETDFDMAPRLSEGMLMFHGFRDAHPTLTKLLGGDDVFGSYCEYQGSIGGNLLNLVTGRAVAMARRRQSQTSWDDSPLALFCRVAGIRIFQILPTCLSEVTPLAPTDGPIEMPSGLLYVHSQYVDELANRLPITMLR